MRLSRIAAFCAALVPTPVLACASCGCTFTSDWLSEGLVTQPGQAITIRYDYVPQTELRSGTDTVDRSNIPLPTDREIERRTDNHYVTVSYDRQFASDWGFGVSVPFIARPHSTIAEDTTQESASSGSGVGDVKLLARWQGLSTPSGVTGLQLGLVLPTGSFHHTFNSGPAAGELVDRGLQPGTGTVQAVFGVYHYRRLSGTVALVAQAQAQVALDSREEYRPGTIGEASISLQWLGWRWLTPQLQVNGRINGRDSGEQADRENSGGEQLYVAPGLSARINSRVSAFGLVQVPIYSRFNGYQLASKVNFSTGLQFRF